MAAWPPKGRRELTDRRPWSRQLAQAGRVRASGAAGGRCQGRREAGSRGAVPPSGGSPQTPKEPGQRPEPGVTAGPKAADCARAVT